MCSSDNAKQKEGTMASYTLTRSPRRHSIGVQILPDATVAVRAPLYATEQEIEDFVESKAQWIQIKRTMMLDRCEKRATFRLEYGGPLLVMGKEWRLRSGQQSGYDRVGKQFFLPPGLSQEEMKAQCVTVYRKLAKDVLSQKTGYFAKRLGVQPMLVEITGACSCWGSCSGKAAIHFSWRLMMAPEGVIDYVVVHELAHLREMNHSGRFWAIVADEIHNIPRCCAQLKQLQERLANETWGQ
jgi:predicted metal-dependent hydrolase